MSCEYFDICAFMANMNTMDPLTAVTVKITYCEHDKYACARYTLYEVLAADDVPDYLWPNDEEEALEIVKIKTRDKKKSRMNE